MSWRLLLFGLMFACTLCQGAEDPVLRPGDGWSGPLPAVAVVGKVGDPGFAATAIARWDVVPFQDVSAPFPIGVIAFHINGIDRVEFAVEGGPWVAVRDMTLNPRTRTYEYWTTLDPAVFPASREGRIEVRAVVHPRQAGQPRVLAEGSSTRVDEGDGSLFLTLDRGGLPHQEVRVAADGDDESGDGSLDKPFKTIDAAIAKRFPSAKPPQEADTSGVLDGAIIHLGEGRHAGPKAGFYDMRRWLTITAAPGTDPAKVVIASGGRPSLGLLRFANLTWQPGFSHHLVHCRAGGRRVWFDRVRGIGGGRDTFGHQWVNNADTWYTDTSISNFKQGVDTANGTVFMARHVAVRQVHEDPFRMHKLLVNCTTHDVDKGKSEAHPDIVQISGNPRNVIVFNLKATDVRAQGIQFRGRDYAMVNVFIQQADGWKYFWQTTGEGPVQHALLWHCGTVGQTLSWRLGKQALDSRDISVRNCAFTAMSAFKSPHQGETDTAYLAGTAMRIDNNNFENGAFAQGLGATMGGAAFAGRAKDAGWAPAPQSPVLDRVKSELLVPCDVDNQPRTLPDAIGPFRAPRN